MFSYRVSFSWYFKFQIMDIYYICRFFCYKLTPILKFWIYNPSCRTSDGQDTCETTLASKTETLYIQIALWWPWQHWCCLELLHTDEPKTELNKEEIWKNKDCSLPIGGIYTTLDTGHLQLCYNFFFVLAIGFVIFKRNCWIQHAIYLAFNCYPNTDINTVFNINTAFYTVKEFNTNTIRRFLLIPELSPIPIPRFD